MDLHERIAELESKLDGIDNELGKLAGAMLNRTLDTSSKQAVGYAECAAMVAKFAAQLRNGEHVTKDGE